MKKIMIMSNGIYCESDMWIRNLKVQIGHVVFFLDCLVFYSPGYDLLIGRTYLNEAACKKDWKQGIFEFFQDNRKHSVQIDDEIWANLIELQHIQEFDDLKKVDEKNIDSPEFSLPTVSIDFSSSAKKEVDDLIAINEILFDETWERVLCMLVT